jgi:predicted DNA-binding WGR domain protein
VANGSTGRARVPEVARKAVLQVTDLKTNHNKYYGVELHKGTVKGKPVYRVFTHYGRTDDLETNPDAGQKECRYAATEGEAAAIYQSIYAEKTSSKKGYKELALASSKIGSQKAAGRAPGRWTPRRCRSSPSRRRRAARPPPPRW